MARKGKQAVRNGRLPAWSLVVIGIVVGAVCMGIILHWGHMPISRPDQGPQPTAGADQDNGGPGIAPKQQAQKKPQYDFYSVLPEKEVVIPDAQLSAKAKAEQQSGATNGGASGQGATASSAQTSDQYMLQVGSFPDRKDAETLKARLALKGFRSEIQPTTINGKVWNRVRLGPYSTATALEAVKKRLAAEGIQSNAIKVL